MQAILLEKYPIEELKMNRNLIWSAAIYFVGMLLFLVCDVYVSSHFSNDFISSWAFYKSLIIVIGSLSLLGYDQVFIREQKLIKLYRGTFARNVLIISFLTVLVVSYVRELIFVDSVKLFLSIIIFSILTYISAATRANNNLWKSQFSSNFWKILILLFLLYSTLDILEYFLISIMISLVLSFFLKGYFPDGKEIIDSDLRLDESSAVARSFFFTSLTLLFSTYGEQLLINFFNKQELSSQVFKYYSIYTPIALSVNGFIGFILAPRIRRMKTFNRSSFVKLNYVLFFSTIVLTLVSFFGGYLYLEYFSSMKLETNYLILILLFLICIIRGVYTATSVCLGVFGSAKSIKKTAYGFWIGAGIFLIIVCFVLNYDIRNSVYLILLATLINWLIRLVVSNYYSFKSLNNKLL